jgi:hypothetical protein
MIILRRTAYYMRALGRESLPPQNSAWLAANAYDLNAIFNDIEHAARANYPNICTHKHPALRRHDIRQYLEAHGYRVDHHTIAWDHAAQPPPLY